MKNKSKFIILALIMLISVIGVSYAFFEYYRVGDNSSKLIFGDIYLKMNEGKDTITLLNVFPETAEKARARSDNQITFTVSGINTTTNKDIWYEIMLNEGNEVEGRTRFNPEDLVFDLIEVNEDKTETYLVDAQSFGDINAKRIWVETVNRNTTKEVNKTYKLRMWLSEDVFISDTNPNATYDVETFESSYASVKVSVYGDFQEKNVIIGYITYDVNGVDVDAPPKQAIYSDGSTTINYGLADSTLGLFAGWATSADGEVEYKKGDKVVEVGDVTLYAVWLSKDLVTRIENSITLSAADVDGTRFVTGEVDNNYVWYSGKLWRIVSIDKDGNIKLVTQGNMTAIAWDTSETNADYSTSQIRNWLNNNNDDGFLKSLHNAENLLVDHEWDYTTYVDFPTQKATENIMKLEGEGAEKVGLLNIHEYMMTGGNTSYSISKTFLNNGYYWWTMSPKTSGSNVWYVSYSGSAACNNFPTYSYGARPSVNLKSGITVLGGTGEKTNPYTIEGDKVIGTTSELLSNRISGEYINFNNTKYRIVGIETINGQQLTKVTMADYDDNKKNVLTTSIAFGSTTTYSTSEGIGKYLLDWYNATEESDTEGTYAGLYISDTYKKMIATSGDGVYWWIGSGTSTRDYTLSKSGTTVETPIGLGYYGEMFSSQFGEGYGSSTNTWLMTKYSGSYVWYVYDYGRANYISPTDSRGARPSFYLKSDVKITDGTGQPDTPYEISQ